LTYAIDLDDPAVREEALRRINETSGELNKAVGITFTDIGPGRLVATMPVDGNRQPFGLLHGGASCVLAESLGSVAAGMHAGPEAVPVGVDINATHHRSAREGLVTGVCTPLHQGRSTATYEIVISDSEGRRLCTARITCQLLRRQPA
jgi:1,4-dihydroxy-2-naphthoyl-CoA hydrolase